MIDNSAFHAVLHDEVFFLLTLCIVGIQFESHTALLLEQAWSVFHVLLWVAYDVESLVLVPLRSEWLCPIAVAVVRRFTFHALFLLLVV
jgi:hypothetical protein